MGEISHFQINFFFLWKWFSYKWHNLAGLWDGQMEAVNYKGAQPSSARGNAFLRMFCLGGGKNPIEEYFQLLPRIRDVLRVQVLDPWAVGNSQLHPSAALYLPSEGRRTCVREHFVTRCGKRRPFIPPAGSTGCHSSNASGSLAML